MSIKKGETLWHSNSRVNISQIWKWRRSVSSKNSSNNDSDTGKFKGKSWKDKIQGSFKIHYSNI